MEFYDIILVLLFLIFFCYSFHNQNGYPTNWPLVGMAPALLKNLHKLNDYLVEIFDKSESLTFAFNGPLFTRMDVLFTANPANIHHVMSKNFEKYEKGSKFSIETCDVLGQSIINSDSTVWQYLRGVAQLLIGNPQFQRFWVKELREKVEVGLIPVLDHVSKHGLEVDMQDLFSRFAFDVSCIMIMDYDPRSLSIDWPNDPSIKALDDVGEVIFHRFLMPTFVWKFQRWIDVGKEKKYREAWQNLDNFLYKCIDQRREEMNKGRSKARESLVKADMLTLFMNDDENYDKDDKFKRDNLLSLLFAGRDTISVALTWFFYLLSKNPRVKSKIKEELNKVAMHVEKNSKNFQDQIDKFVYLHAALCEALRLYPPIPFETKTAVEPDILPSGHQVNPNVPIVFCSYAMARMKSIWGDDCCEFKPERWISEKGKIKHEPSYKFFTFMAGPRTCLGKNMAFTQLKVVVATMIEKYDIQAVEGHPIVPDSSMMLRLKYGFKARVLSSM